MHPNFDLAPDGKRVVVLPVSDSGQDTPLDVTFLLNLADELRRRIPSPR